MSEPFKIGLTGSIGMGKSTTADMFRRLGIPVWDADAAVADLYREGQPGAQALATLFPEKISGAVNRETLREIVAEQPDALSKIEAIVHPLVADHRNAFVSSATSDLILLDIPLLFEIGAEGAMDHIVVVSAPKDIQRERVLARPGMTEARFEAMVSRQIPDAEKRARADTVIETTTLDGARDAVEVLIRDLRRKLSDA